MSWLHEHAAELGAIGSIFMNLATIVIIYFNVHQLKLNSHSLNVDINFKVFELRKNVYQQTLAFIKSLCPESGLRPHLVELDNGEFDVSQEVKDLVELVDNYKYLFAQEFITHLENLILNIKGGMQTEINIAKLKAKDPTLWSTEDQTKMHNLGYQLKDISSAITSFNLDQFLPYLNVSNFHKDLMRAEHDELQARNPAFTRTVFLVKRGLNVLPKLINKKKIKARIEPF